MLVNQVFVGPNSLYLYTQGNQWITGATPPQIQVFFVGPAEANAELNLNPVWLHSNQRLSSVLTYYQADPGNPVGLGLVSLNAQVFETVYSRIATDIDPTSLNRTAVSPLSVFPALSANDRMGEGEMTFDPPLELNGNQLSVKYTAISGGVFPVIIALYMIVLNFTN